ncbi:hypothetical protein FS837_010094 [Tulasnella sp. UAMH 9824]|nr:hypothetical protein FS837_010094 [Tulasnella sp. UAMH 9824]
MSSNAPNNWEQRRDSGSSGWSNASSNPASINQRPRVPQDSFANSPAAIGPSPGMVHRNPFQNPSPSPSVYGDTQPLHPPNPPFGSLRPNSQLSADSRSSSRQNLTEPLSLSVGFLPNKFSRPLSPGISYRKANKPGSGLVKRGGGTRAFGPGASRMPGDNDEDYDGVDPGRKGGRLHWNGFKWILFTTNTILTLYSMAALIFSIVIWFNVWSDADIITVGNRGELIASTVAASACLFTALIGWAGILLNNRAFLAVYTLCLWVSFGLLVVPGYLTYKKRAFNLEGKINAQWSRSLGIRGRLTIQNLLGCCGYFSPYVEATVSAKCYSRSQLEGCKGPYMRFEKRILEKWYIMTFSLVPFHLACIVASLLCSNHVTHRFGKGMMPKAYRLNQEAMAVIMETYANQLAEQYGEEQTVDQYGKTRSNSALIDSYGSRSRDSSNSGHEVPLGGASYGSTTGLVDSQTQQHQYPRGRDKRI